MAKCFFDLAEDDILTNEQKNLIKVVPGLSGNDQVASMLGLHILSSNSCTIRYNLEWWRPVLQRIEKIFKDDCKHCGIVCCASDSKSKGGEEDPAGLVQDALPKVVDRVYQCLRFVRELLLRSYNKDAFSAKAVEHLNNFLRSVDDRLADEALWTLETLVQEQPSRLDINFTEREMVDTSAHNNAVLRRSLCQIIQGWSFGTMKTALLGCKIMARDVDFDFRFSAGSGIQVCTLSDDVISSKTTYLSMTAAQSRFKIPGKHLASLLVMIRYCRDLRNRATAAKAIRRRLVAFQVLLPTTMDSVSCIQRIILRHGGILNETVELIKTPLIIPAGVQQAGLGLLNALVKWCGQTSNTGSFEFLSAKLGVTAALGLWRTHHHSGVISTIVRTTLSLMPSLVSGCTYNVSASAKARKRGFADNEDQDLAIGLLFVEALKQVSSNTHSDSHKQSLVWVESVFALSNSVALTKRGPALFVDSGLFPCALDILGATNRPTEAMFAPYYSLLTQLVELLDTVLRSPTNLVTFLDMQGFDVVVQTLCREVADMFPRLEDYDLLPFIDGEVPLSMKAIKNRNFGSQILVRSLFELASSIILRSSTLNCTRFFEKQSKETDDAGSTTATVPLVQCITSIFERSTEVHPLIFSLNAKFLTNIINQNPASVSIIYESGVGEAFLRTIRKQEVPKNPAVYASIPIHLRALGLSKSTESKVLASPCPILATLRLFLNETSSKDTASASRTLGKALEELMHHSDQFKSHVVSAITSIFKDFYNIWGRVPVPMVWLTYMRPLKCLCKIIASVLTSESHAMLFVKTELVPLLFCKIPKFLSERRHPLFLNSSTWQKFPVTAVIQAIGRSPMLVPGLFILMNEHVKTVMDLPLLIDHEQSTVIEKLNQNVHNAMEKHEQSKGDGQVKHKLRAAIEWHKIQLRKFLRKKEFQKTVAGGWEKIYSTKHERYYFFNHISKVSQWDPPPVVCPDTLNSSTAAVLGWQLHTLGWLVRRKVPQGWKVELTREQAKHPEVMLDLIKNMNSLRCRFRESYAESLLSAEETGNSTGKKIDPSRASRGSVASNTKGTPAEARAEETTTLPEAGAATDKKVTKPTTTTTTPTPSAPQHAAPLFCPPEDEAAIQDLQSSRALARYQELELSDQPRLLTKTELLQFLRSSRRFLSLGVRLTSTCAIAVASALKGPKDPGKLTLHVHQILETIANTVKDSTTAVAKCSFNKTVTHDLDLVTLRSRMYASLIKDVLAFLYHKTCPNTMMLILLHKNGVLKELLGHCFDPVHTTVRLQQQVLGQKNLLLKFTRLQKAISTACWLAERVTAYHNLNIKSPLTRVLHRCKPLRDAFGLAKFDGGTCHEFIQNLHATVCQIILPVWAHEALPLVLTHSGMRKFVNTAQYILEVSMVDTVPKKSASETKKLAQQTARDMKRKRAMLGVKNQILGMGYPEARVEQAMAAVGRPDAQRIVLWLLNNTLQESEDEVVSDLELAKRMSLETSPANSSPATRSGPPAVVLGLSLSEREKSKANSTKLRERLVDYIIRVCMHYQTESWTDVKDDNAEAIAVETHTKSPDAPSATASASMEIVSSVEKQSLTHYLATPWRQKRARNPGWDYLPITKEGQKDLGTLCTCLIDLVYIGVLDINLVVEAVVKQARKCVAELKVSPSCLPPSSPLYSVLNMLVALLLSKTTSPLAHFQVVQALANELTDLLTNFARVHQGSGPIDTKPGDCPESKTKSKRTTTDSDKDISKDMTSQARPSNSDDRKQTGAEAKHTQHSGIPSSADDPPWPMWISGAIYIIDLVVTLPVVGAQSAECAKHLERSANQIQVCVALLKHSPKLRVFQAIVSVLRRLVCRDDLVARFVELHGVQALVTALKDLLFQSDKRIDSRAITFTQYILQRSCRTHQVLVGLLAQRIKDETRRRLNMYAKQQQNNKTKKSLTFPMFTKQFKFSIQRSPGAFMEAAASVIKRRVTLAASSSKDDTQSAGCIELRTAADRDLLMLGDIAKTQSSTTQTGCLASTAMARIDRPIARMSSQDIAHLVVNVIIDEVVAISSITPTLSQDPSMFFLLSLLSHLMVTVPSMKSALLIARPGLATAMPLRTHPAKRKRELKISTTPIKNKRRREGSKRVATENVLPLPKPASAQLKSMNEAKHKLTPQSPHLIRFLVRKFLVEEDHFKKSSQKVSQALHRLLCKICVPVWGESPPVQADARTLANYRQRQRLRDARDQALFFIVFSELKTLLNSNEHKLNIRSYRNIAKVIDAIVAWPLTKLKRAIRSRTGKPQGLSRSLVLQAAYRTEILQALFDMLRRVVYRDPDAISPDFVKIVIKAAEHLTRRSALTAGSRKSFLPLQQLEKGTAPQNSTSRSAFKRVGQTPGCATEAMLIENDIEETIEGERAEDESEDEEDEEEDTSEIDDDLEDMIVSDIQRANDQDDDEDNDSDSGEDAMVMQVGQMFDADFGPQVVEVEQLVARPTAVDSEGEEEEEEDGDEDEEGEEEAHDDDDDEEGVVADDNESRAESDGVEEEGVLEDEQALIADEIANSSNEGEGDSFALPVHLPPRNREELEPDEVESDERVGMVDTYVRIARLGDRQLGNILGMRARMRASNREDGSDSADDDEEPEGRAVVVAFAPNGRFRNLRGARRSHSDGTHPLMQFDLDASSSSPPEIGDRHTFDNPEDRDETSGPEWHGILTRAGEDDDETIATQLSRISSLATRLNRISSTSELENDDASGTGLNAQLHARRLEAKRRLATTRRVKEEELMWIKWGMPHWVDSSGQFLTHDAPALHEPLLEKIAVVHATSPNASKKKRKASSKNKSKASSGSKQGTEDKANAQTGNAASATSHADTDLPPLPATVVSIPSASSHASDIAVATGTPAGSSTATSVAQETTTEARTASTRATPSIPATAVIAPATSSARTSIDANTTTLSTSASQEPQQRNLSAARNATGAASEAGQTQEIRLSNTHSVDLTQSTDGDLPPIPCPPHVDRDVFALLPRNLQQHVVDETESVRNAVINAPEGVSSGDRSEGNTPAGASSSGTGTQPFARSNYSADVLSALPTSIRNEVLQDERQSRDQQTPSSNTNNVAENLALLNSVGPEMRRDILLQANAQFLSNMPENIVQEAQALQRQTDERASRARSETTERQQPRRNTVAFMRPVNLGSGLRRQRSFGHRGAPDFDRRRRECEAVVTRLLPQFLHRSNMAAMRSDDCSGWPTIKRPDVKSAIIDRLRVADVLRVIYIVPFDCSHWNYYLRLLNNLCWHKDMRSRILSSMLSLMTCPFAPPSSRTNRDAFPPPDLYGAGLDGVHESKPARASRIVFRLLFALGKMIKTNKAIRGWFLNPTFSAGYKAAFKSSPAPPSAVELLVGILGSPLVQGNKLHAQLLITILRVVLRNVQKQQPKIPEASSESKEDVEERETKEEDPPEADTASAQKKCDAEEPEPHAESRSQPMWGFEDNYGRNFTKFSDENNSIIEDAYQAGQKQVDIVCKRDKRSTTYRVHFMEGLFLRENLKTHVKQVVLRGFKDAPKSVSEVKIRCPKVLRIFVTAFTSKEAESSSKEQEDVFNVLKHLCLEPNNKTVAFEVLTERILLLAGDCIAALREQDLEAETFKKQHTTAGAPKKKTADGSPAVITAKGSFALVPKSCDRLLLHTLQCLLFLCKSTGVDMHSVVSTECVDTLKRLWNRMGATMSQLWTSFSTPGQPTRDATISNMGARFLCLIDSLFLFHTQLCKSSENLAMFVKTQQVLLNCLVRQNKVLLKGAPAYLGYRSFASLVEDRFCRVYLEFDVKRLYFRLQISKRHKRYASIRPVEVTVRRDHCFEDSFKQLGFAKAKLLRGKITIHFEGEEGVDAGGLTREWYRILARGMFNQDNALFTVSADSPAYQPNQYSRINESHLLYFKFIGRIIGKALVDGYQFDAYFTRSFYKHMLGLKPTMEDMGAVDPEYYKNLQQILKYDLDDLDLELFFTVRTSFCGEEKTHVLKPGGDKIEVTNENKAEYVQLVTQHRMCTAIKDQITAFLEGFHDMVDKDLISIFDETELELLISGLPTIDIEDLRKNTDYVNCTIGSQNIIWFWEVLRTFTEEEKAKFLQFVTGTSKVPLEGFKMLKGMRGITKFNIHKVAGGPKRLPSAHTCFNQLDLPEYETAEQMRKKLQLVLSEGTEGFAFA